VCQAYRATTGSSIGADEGEHCETDEAVVRMRQRSHDHDEETEQERHPDVGADTVGRRAPEVVSGESRVREGHRQGERRRVDEHHRQHGDAADEQTDHAEQTPTGEEPAGGGDHETVEEEGDADGQSVALVGAAVQGVAEDLAEHEQASEDRPRPRTAVP
jgi:hypothetical protein